ncbi:MAG: sulfite exporter TauE/SafE family protein [Alphaproteobacteria bacterium]|nr:sulfite exporter TauE/SafE family protein [Alphaproteobacteria bacterium]MDE2013116.1 sulfite exporter TauE/SafE family protein [Alphaproteobacteria bacterium]MDE2073049.1 sulfite exporter TauE/SafE family protein [Alphaproteobacteria bacterium]MDE2351936.1 sulfite exporter TauE/SafE family protein [Alphaproteobacteria bacterium]
MSFLHAANFVYVFSGFFVGMLVGITGVGGGSLMTPILILFGIHPATAVGTDLLYASVTKTGGSLVHGFNHTVDWRIVVRLATGSVPGAALALFVLYELHIDKNETQFLITRVLGAALFLTALALFLRRPLIRAFRQYVGPIDPERVRWLTVACGFLLGVLVSISSVGAGAIGVTFLILLYPELPMARVVGSDIAHAVPLTLIAGFGHLLMGSINWALLVTLLIGSLPGIVVGSSLAARLPDNAVRLTLAGTLLIVCGKMLFY